MYEEMYPEDTPRKARALLFDRAGQFVCLARIKPGQSIYHVTVGGKLEADESTESAVLRELKEEIDADALIGRPFLTVLDTTYHVALLLHCGANPFNGPEFADPSLGRFAISRVPLSRAISPEFDLRPYAVTDFLTRYGKAVLAESQRLYALTY